MIGTKEQFETILLNYQKILASLSPLGFSIQQIELNSHQVWEILLTNGIIIFLKEKDPIKQMEFLVSIYKRVIAGHENLPKTIDLRYSDGLAVKWE
ncbi:MAG: cell division protein FtsQ [uncultured bacterium]|nr:MAG: cell division protein FtsQ [uncultured bacterium]